MCRVTSCFWFLWNGSCNYILSYTIIYWYLVYTNNGIIGIVRFKVFTGFVRYILYVVTLVSLGTLCT